MLQGPFEPPAAMIIIQGLTKKFGSITAVSGIDLTVAKGEVLGFLGPNGAGKSTTMKMIAGYFTPTAGRGSRLYRQGSQEARRGRCCEDRTRAGHGAADRHLVEGLQAACRTGAGHSA